MLSGGGDTTSAFLVGRLTQEGLTPDALLRVGQGRVPLPTGQQVLAVAGGRLWLAHSQLIGGPSVASVPLGLVTAVSAPAGRRLLGGRARQLRLTVDGADLGFTVLDDVDAGAAFLHALGPR